MLPRIGIWQAVQGLGIGIFQHGAASVLVKCYECFGHQFTGNLRCHICAGKGTLDNEKICHCGRAVCRTVNGQEICWTLTCELRVSPKKTEVTSQAPFDWGEDNNYDPMGPPDILRMY